MGILADILIIAILIINIIIGYKKGLVNVIFNIFAFLIAIIITFIAYKPISEIIIKNTSIYDNIKSTIINNSNKIPFELMLLLFFFFKNVKSESYF